MNRLLKKRSLLLKSVNPYIVFEDPEVERVLIEHGVGNEEGILPEELAALTDIGTWFQGNTTITSFPELKDTGVTTVEKYAFNDCTSLKNIDLTQIATIKAHSFSNTAIEELNCPSLTLLEMGVNQERCGTFAKCESLRKITSLGTITSIPHGGWNVGPYSGQGVFQKCTSLSDVTLPETLTSIGSSAFWGDSSLTALKIPSRVTDLGEFTFSCSGLKLIDIPSGVSTLNRHVLSYCSNLVLNVRAVVPPTVVSSEVFQNTTFEHIYVPSGSVEAYKAAEGWSPYASIISPAHEIGDIAYWDGNNIAFTPYMSWQSSLGTALGVCFIPTSHAKAWGDGKARFLAVTGVNADGSHATSNIELHWDGSGRDAGLTKFAKLPTWDNTVGGSRGSNDDGNISSDRFTSGVQNVIDTMSRYSSSSTMIPSPYTADGSFYSDYIRTIEGNNALSDFSGKANTTTIVSALGSTGGQAAKACSLYSTDGIGVGEWYLPALGELAYLIPRFNIISSALTACSGVSLPTSRIRSSTENNGYRDWAIYLNSGYVGNNSKTTRYAVRPICALE